MILGASHMTLACASLEDGLAQAAAQGLKTEFSEPDLPSHPSKAGLLSQPFDTHAIAFLRSDHGLPVELVSYHRPPPGPAGRFQPCYGPQAPPGLPAAARTAFAAVSGPSGLQGAAIGCPDVAAGRDFWQVALGYREVASGEGAEGPWSVLRREGPVPQWRFGLLLHLAPAAPLPSLDGPGMTCLSHLCSDMAADRARLLENGATVATEAFEAMVNGRRLAVAIARGPAGEYVELLQVKG